MKIGFWVEQCTHALFECPDDIHEITKNHTKVVSGEFCGISLFLQKWILGKNGSIQKDSKTLYKGRI